MELPVQFEVIADTPILHGGGLGLLKGVPLGFPGQLL